jgi:uncharacterized membrane protein
VTAPLAGIEGLVKATLLFLKTTILGGVLVLLPLLIIVAAVQKAFGIAVSILEPIENLLPGLTVLGVRLPYVMAALIIVLICFLAGLLARTELGTRFRRNLERRVLDRIPGYAMFRSMVSGTLPTDQPVDVALVEMEGMQCIAFVMERNPNGYVTLFVPSAPTPTAGSVFFVEASRVQVIDASIKDALNCISRLGMGSGPALQRALGGSSPS